MSDEKRTGRPRRGSIDWAAIRDAFEKGETNVSTLSRTFGVKRDSIAAHRDREHWATAQQIAGTVKSNVVDIMTRRAVEKIEESGGVDVLAELLKMQAPLQAKAAKLIDQTMDKALAGQLKLGVTQGETTALNDILGALARFSTDIRKGAGLTDGTPSIGEAVSDKTRLVEWEVIPLPDRAESA